MTITEAFTLASFSLFSYADLRYRLVPGIEVFLFGTILLTLPATPIQTAIVVLACARSIFRNLSGWLVLPLLFYPPIWPVLLAMGMQWKKPGGLPGFFERGGYIDVRRIVNARRRQNAISRPYSLGVNS